MLGRVPRSVLTDEGGLRGLGYRPDHRCRPASGRDEIAAADAVVTVDCRSAPPCVDGVITTENSGAIAEHGLPGSQHIVSRA